MKCAQKLVQAQYTLHPLVKCVWNLYSHNHRYQSTAAPENHHLHLRRKHCPNIMSFSDIVLKIVTTPTINPII